MPVPSQARHPTEHLSVYAENVSDHNVLLDLLTPVYRRHGKRAAAHVPLPSITMSKSPAPGRNRSKNRFLSAQNVGRSRVPQPAWAAYIGG